MIVQPFDKRCEEERSCLQLVVRVLHNSLSLLTSLHCSERYLSCGSRAGSQSQREELKRAGGVHEAEDGEDISTTLTEK